MRTYQQDLEPGVSVQLNCWAFSLLGSSSLSILTALCSRERKDFSCRDGSDLGDTGSVSFFAQITFVT